MSMTRTSKMAGNKTDPPLECVTCLRYPVQFCKDQTLVDALLDCGSEVNAMHPAYAKNFCLKIEYGRLT